MTNHTYRALCAELADELQGYKVAHPMHCRALLTHARAALAQPEPVAPTDEELLRLYGVATPCYHVEEYRRELDYARAVWRLARWNTPTAQPVPASERLPGPEDCDSEGCCWAIGERGNWMCVYVIGKSWSNPIYTHWLPHWALPVPTPAIAAELEGTP
jgi:hypothetical protein